MFAGVRAEDVAGRRIRRSFCTVPSYPIGEMVFRRYATVGRPVLQAGMLCGEESHDDGRDRAGEGAGGVDGIVGDPADAAGGDGAGVAPMGAVLGRLLAGGTPATGLDGGAEQRIHNRAEKAGNGDGDESTGGEGRDG